MLQSQIGEVAGIAPPDDLGTLTIARDLRAQQVELRDPSGFTLLPHLLGGASGLRQGGLRDRHEAVAQHRVEIGLRDVERQLRASRGQRQRGILAAEAGPGILGLQPAAGVDVL